MHRALTPALLAGVILSAPSPARAACDGTSGSTGAITIEVATLPRTFVVRAPSSAEARTPAPVVFAFHPFGMNAQYMQSRVSSRFWPEALLVYPEGARGAGGAPSWQGGPGDAGDRDVQFFDAMLAWLDAAHCIDRGRVFVMGYSNGAGFANVLACARAAAIAGVAIASGRPTCAPATAKAVIIGHGTRDTTIGYEQAIQAMRAWSAVNGCSAPPPPGTPGCVAATACSAAPATMCTYPGGHEYNPEFSRTFLEFFQKTGS